MLQKELNRQTYLFHLCFTFETDGVFITKKKRFKLHQLPRATEKMTPPNGTARSGLIECSWCITVDWVG